MLIGDTSSNAWFSIVMLYSFPGCNFFDWERLQDCMTSCPGALVGHGLAVRHTEAWRNIQRFSGRYVGTVIMGI